ncbi:MAG: hypothetical protein KDD94_06575, partial [Calditrichaeota bacterium]|nr:hypothetical protein [Calditrichota bacterium]
VLFILISCSNTPKTTIKPSVNVRSKPEPKERVKQPPKKVSFTYATKEGQDRADIKLTLFSDHSFGFWMTIFSPDEQKTSSSEFSGKWQEKDGRIIVEFIGARPILTALIEAENQTVQVLDEHRFAFAKDSQEIHIWGLLLDRI